MALQGSSANKKPLFLSLNILLFIIRYLKLDILSKNLSWNLVPFVSSD